jgi:hypothetical protein
MSDSEKEGSSGNGVQSERLELPADAQKPETMAGPVKSLPAPSAPAAAVDPATAKAVEGVLFSDVCADSVHGALLILQGRHHGVAQQIEAKRSLRQGEYTALLQGETDLVTGSGHVPEEAIYNGG